MPFSERPRTEAVCERTFCVRRLCDGPGGGYRFACQKGRGAPVSRPPLREQPPEAFHPLAHEGTNCPVSMTTDAPAPRAACRTDRGPWKAVAGQRLAGQSDEAKGHRAATVFPGLARRPAGSGPGRASGPRGSRRARGSSGETPTPHLLRDRTRTSWIWEAAFAVLTRCCSAPCA